MTRAIQTFEQALQIGAEGVADGISKDLDELLSDPLVESLMTADRVDLGKLKAALKKIAGTLRREVHKTALTERLC